MYAVPKLDDYSPDALDKAVAELTSALERESFAVSDEASWKDFRDRWMARKNGVLTQINDLWLKAAPGPQKREVGRRVNELKAKVEAVVEGTRGHTSGAAAQAKLKSGALDVTLPG